jgi:hypothetical protein
MSTAQAVLSRVRAELNDDSPTYRYSDTVLLRYLGLAMYELVRYRPDAYTVRTPYVFANTAARQRLTGNFYAVLRVESNLDTTSGVPPYAPGRPIRTTERDVLDAFYAAWPTAGYPAGTNGTRYTVAAVDKADPLAFWVFPQPVVAQAVLLKAVAIPPAPVATTDVLPVSDIFIPELVHYTTHVALRSESLGENDSNSLRYLDSFLASLGQSRINLDGVNRYQPRPPGATQ